MSQLDGWERKTMKHPERFPHGAPCWVDLMTSDVPAALDQYAALLGWTYVDGTEESGFYTMALVDGAPVAGIGALAPDAQLPPSWTVYLSVDSAEACAEAVRGAGGTVVMGPMDVETPELQGRMAVVADPAGAVFGIWEPAAHTGFGAVEEAGTVVWSECMTRDAQATRMFLADVFGFGFEQIGDGEGFDYTVGSVGDAQVIGVMAMGDSFPAEVLSHWLPYFQVEDPDRTAELLTGSGGRVMMGPEDTPYGRIVVGTDPQGAVVAFLKPAPTG